MGKAFDIIKQGLTEAIGHGKGTHVGAEQNLTHHADSILTRGWKPTA